MKLITIALALAAFLPLAAEDKKANVLLQAALARETVQGDLKGAIELYGQAVKQAGANRALAAKTLVHMAECYQKMGDTESRKIYEQVVREYADQKEATAIARSHLGQSVDTPGAGASFRRVWSLPSKATVRNSERVSPDGRYFPYADYEAHKGDLFLHDLITGADRRLTDTGSASQRGTGVAAEQFADGETAFSRDSKQLAYTWHNEKGLYEIRVVDLRGNGIPQPRRLLGNEDIEWLMPAGWSPDGKWIAAQVERRDGTTRLELISALDGSLRLLRKMEWRSRFIAAAAFTPDGKYIAFDAAASPEAQQRDIFVIAADRSREIPVVVHPANDGLVGWSPDGKRLLFTSDRTGRTDLWSLPFWDGKSQGEPELIKSAVDLQSSFGITDSGSIYSVVSPQHPTDIKVATVDFATGRFVSPPVSLFPGNNESPQWSLDGKFLAYVSRPQAGPSVIGIHAWETGQTRELRPKLVRLFAPRWSPDGHSFMAWGRDLDLHWGIYRIDAQSGDVTRELKASNLAGNPDPCWSPDGKSLYYRQAFAQTREVAFIERDLASGKEREIVRRPSLGGISVSPDGRFIATLSFDASTKSKTVALIPVLGGEFRELLRVPSGQAMGIPGWAPDSRSIYLRKPSSDPKQDQELIQVAIDGGVPGKPLRLDPNADWVSIHPDGHRIAFQLKTPEHDAGSPGEVWVLEKLLPNITSKK